MDLFVVARPIQISARRAALHLSVAAMLAMTAAASADITLNADFDTGSLNVAGSTIVGSTITLAARTANNSTNTSSAWINFQASNVNGLTPTFKINVPDSARKYVYSYDGQNWSNFTNGSLSGSTYTFSNSTPFTQNTVYVAYGVPYTMGMVDSYVARIATSPYVTPTSSGNSSLVIGRTLGTAGGGYVDDLGRSVSAQNIYGYHITDPNVTGTKTKIILAGGNHSMEMTGNWVLQGLTDFLLSSDPRAASLRAKADFYIYPETNPEGRAAGYVDSNPAVPNVNHNRYWDQPPVGSDVAQVEAAMKADTGGKVDYFFDFHSHASVNDPIAIYDVVRGPGTKNPSAFINDLTNYTRLYVMAGYSLSDVNNADVWSTTATATAPKVAGLDCPNAFTPETSFMLGGGDTTKYTQVGVYYGLALNDVVPAVSSPVPLPSAIWAGMGLLGSMGAVAGLRRRLSGR